MEPGNLSIQEPSKRKLDQSSLYPEHLRDFFDVVLKDVEESLKRKNARTLAGSLLSEMGYTDPENAPPISVAKLITKSVKQLSTISRKATLQRISVQQENYAHQPYFGAGSALNVDVIVEIVDFLEPTEKFKLGSLNRSWKKLMNMPFMWPVLDPLPVRSFAKCSDMQLFLHQHKEKFLTCKGLQMPGVASSVKMFKDIIACMPQLSQISLHNITGSGSLRHLVAATRQPLQLLQLSFGLSTKVTPAEVVSALKHFVNLRALEMSFWHNDAAFDVLAEALGSLHSLQYLSLSQSFYYPHGYSLEQDTMNDAFFVQIAMKCVNLRDVHLSSFYAVTNETWKAFSKYCHRIRSFSIEDCGLCIDAEGARALISISPSVLRNLVVLPRYVGNVSSFLPSAGLPYVTDSAFPVFSLFRARSPEVNIFTRRDPVRHHSVMFINVVSMPIEGADSSTTQVSTRRPWPLAFDMEKMKPCDDLSSMFGILIDCGTAGESYYRHLVSIGHVAAFRMYMDQHLLPFSYFNLYGKYT